MIYRSKIDLDTDGIDARERGRVERIVAEDVAYRAEQSFGSIDPVTGEPRRVRPSDHVAARRAIAANGMPEPETIDTIGKLWAWGFLDGERFAPDLLRDAGRRYAVAYWFRYGPVVAKSGAYAEMTGRSGGGPPSVVIADPERDEIAESRFRDRDDTIRNLGWPVKVMVDQVCVDCQGDNDPGWLVDLMQGYPVETRDLRAHANHLMLECGAGSKIEQRRKEMAADAADRKLKYALIELRRERVPHKPLEVLRFGLVALAEIDRAEGFHRPKRGRPSKEDD
jgi:hypothetical protein